MTYEGVDAQFQYLDLSRHNLGSEGVLQVLEDLLDDAIIVHANLSYNIMLEEWRNPAHFETFLKKLRKVLVRHKTLTALDLAGNHLFYYHPHPANEHVKHYEKEMAHILKSSVITHIDLSDNNMTGHTGRELNGLIYFCKQFMVNKKAFQCRANNLTSQGIFAVLHCLGVYSSLTYLDLSDNQAGLTPNGDISTEGISALASAIAKTTGLQYLRLARNRLYDEHVQLLGESLSIMPAFLDLDLSGNMCKTYGARALKLAIASHGVQYHPMMGFRSLDLSNNPVGDSGVHELCFAIVRSNTLRALLLHACAITERGGAELQEAMANNATIVMLDLQGNPMSVEQQSLAEAEAEANQLVQDIRADPSKVDADVLSRHMYLALARKLRFVEQPFLAQLHNNPSFNRHGSEMMDELHILEPPPRRVLVADVKKKDKRLLRRLEQSRIVARKVEASIVIFRNVMVWYNKVRRRRNITMALESVMRKEEDFARLFMLDDNSSLGSFGTGSLDDDGSQSLAELM